MRHRLLALPACLLVLATAATARAEDSAAVRCALKAFPPPQAAAPPGYLESVRNRVLGWVYGSPETALARRGGLRLVLRADRDAFRAVLLDDLRDEMRCIMREVRIAHGEIVVRDGGVELQLREASDAPRARAALGTAMPAGSPTGGGDMHENGLIRLAPAPADFDALLGRALDRTVEIIQRRLNELGMASAGVRREGADRILVTLPGGADAAHLEHVVAAHGRLEFRLVDTSLSPQDALRAGVPSGSELVRSAKGGEQLLLRRQAVLTGSDIVEARAALSPVNDRPVISFTFTARGARAFGLFTQENVGRPFAIVFDNEVLSAPVIREPILGGRGEISGLPTMQQAIDFAVLLRAGTLPLDLIPIERKTVEPASK